MKIGLPGAVFLVFLIMKLTHYIAWSWWWVTAPLWGGLAIWLGVIAVLALFGVLAIGVASGLDAVSRRRNLTVTWKRKAK